MGWINVTAMPEQMFGVNFLLQSLQLRLKPGLYIMMLFTACFSALLCWGAVKKVQCLKGVPCFHGRYFILVNTEEADLKERVIKIHIDMFK